MTETKFKDLPVQGYFTYKGIHFVKLTATKARSFGKNTEEVIRSNPVVTYWGQDLNEFISKVNESN